MRYDNDLTLNFSHHLYYDCWLLMDAFMAFNCYLSGKSEETEAFLFV